MGCNSILTGIPALLTGVTQTACFLDEMNDTTVRFRTNGYVDGEKMPFPGHFWHGFS